MEELTIKEDWKAVFKNPETKIILIFLGLFFSLPVILMVGFELYFYFAEGGISDGASLSRGLVLIALLFCISLFFWIIVLVLLILPRWSAIKSPKTFEFSYKSGQLLIKENSNIVVDVTLSRFSGLSRERSGVSFFFLLNSMFVPVTRNEAVTESMDCKRFLKRLVSLTVFYKDEDLTGNNQKYIPLISVLREDRISLYHFFQQILKDKEKQLNEL